MAAPKGNTYSALRKTNPTYTEEQIDQICDELLEWAHTDDGLFLASFIYEKYKRSSSWIYELSNHHPQLKAVLDMVKELTAGKVVRHCYIGDRNSSFGEKILPMFSPEYKELLAWKASLANQQTTQTPSNINYIENQETKQLGN